MIWGYRNILGPKNHTRRKMTKFTTILNYIKASCTIFCTKMFGYSHYIYCLQEESTSFGPRVLTSFGLEVLKYLWLRNHTRKIEKICKDYWMIPNYTKSTYITFCTKMFWTLQIIYWQHVPKIFLLLLPAFRTNVP